MTKFLSLTTITTLIFLVTAIYNVAYFSAINIKLITLLHFTDYISNAMNWLPLLVFVLVFISINVIGEEESSLEIEPTVNKKNRRLNFHKKNIFFRLITITFYLFIIYYFYWANSETKNIIIMGVIFFSYIFFVEESRFIKTITKKHGHHIASTFYSFGLIAIVLAIQGFLNAKEDLKQTKTNYYLPANQEESVVLIRYLSNELLIRRISTNTIELIGHDGKAKLIYKLPAIDSDTDSKE